MNIWQGRLVRLRAVEPLDAETHFFWDQDSEAYRRLDRVQFPQSMAAAKRWAEEQSMREPAGDAFHFEIENLEAELVGAIGTHDCDPRNGTFQIGVAIRSEHQRRGFASEAVLLVARYYFLELRYQKLTVFVLGFNEPSILLCKRLGFQQEGQLRRMAYTNGEYIDHLVFGMTVEEFMDQHAWSLSEA